MTWLVENGQREPFWEYFIAKEYFFFFGPGSFIAKENFFLIKKKKGSHDIVDSYSKGNRVITWSFLVAGTF